MAHTASKPQPPAGPAADTSAGPGVATPVVWAIGFLRAIGAPVTPNNIRTIIAWGTAESGAPSAGQPGSPAAQAHGGWNNFNPLNIVTEAGDRHVGQGGTQGNIADFANVQDGVAATAKLFLQNDPQKRAIVQSLRADSNIATVNAYVNQFYARWHGSINFSGFTTDTLNAIGGTTINAPGSQGVGIADRLGRVASGIDAILPAAASAALAPLTAAETLLKIDKTILGVFANWRYVVELMVGGLLVGIGLLIILIDTGAAKRGAQVAAVAALA